MDPKLAEIRHTPENPLSSSYLDLNPEHLGWTLHTPHHSTSPAPPPDNSTSCPPFLVQLL